MHSSMTKGTLIVAAAAALLMACGDSEGDTSSGSGAGGPVDTDCPDPTGAMDLEAFFSAGSYQSWNSESAIHESTGPHFGQVLAYVNDVLFDSVQAVNTTHPRCSAAVKELYGMDGMSVMGYTYWLKIDDDAAAGANIYWYERFNTNTFADGLDDGTCTGCHSGGIDFFNSPAPLQ